MAFPTYQYPGYQPYYGQPAPDQLAQLRQQQLMQVPQQMPMQGQTQAVTAMQAQGAPMVPQNSGIIWVNSKAEADNYLIAPNNAVALWDANDPVIYLRQADGTGKPTTKVFDLVERTEDRPAQQNAPQIDLSKYITRDQVEAIIEDRLEDRLDELLTERLKKPVKGTQRKEAD